MKKLKTLERVISKAGLGSRTEARGWIGGGRVSVNGKVVRDPDQWVEIDRDRVSMDGKPVQPPKDKMYVLFYKPKGYLTTYKDPEGRPTVYDLLGDIPEFLTTVGRLDRDTTGLLILTNDTAFGEQVMNPDYKVAKTYLVKSSKLLTADQLDRLRAGVTLADGPTKPAVVKHLRDGGGKYSHFEITITEGRNRQVRRMVEALGAKVLKLVRVAIGPIGIGDLEIGKWRILEPGEVKSLAGR